MGLYNDSGQVVHTHLPRRRLPSLLYGVVKPRIPLLLSRGNGVANRRGSNYYCEWHGRLLVVGVVNVMGASLREPWAKFTDSVT